MTEEEIDALVWYLTGESLFNIADLRRSCRATHTFSAEMMPPSNSLGRSLNYSGSLEIVRMWEA